MQLYYYQANWVFCLEVFQYLTRIFILLQIYWWVWWLSWISLLKWCCCLLWLQKFMDYRSERGKMLLSRRNQLLLEFSFWNEPVPRPGPNIYELRSYQLRVRLLLRRDLVCVCVCARVCVFFFFTINNQTCLIHLSPLCVLLSARNYDRVGKLLVTHNLISVLFFFFVFFCF